MKNFAVYSVFLVSIFSLSPLGFADTFGTGANQFTIDFVTIGNPGNPADTTGTPNPAGSVPYVYRIGTYEVSREMIEKANTAGGLGLTLAPMDFVPGGPRPSMPATGVSWNEAAHFVNWLNMSQGFSPAYKFVAQPGEVGYDHNGNIEIWRPGDPGYDVNNLFRNSLAHYFLPNSDEWYKAAYFEPRANGGAGGYWDFPTGSDLDLATGNGKPRSVANGTDAGTAVFFRLIEGVLEGPADISLAGGPSPYGVMGLGGNVLEWEETEYDLVNDTGLSSRGRRGGDWYSDFPVDVCGPSCHMLSNARYALEPSFDDDMMIQGFRVASIPEPSTGLLGAFGTIGLLTWRRRASSNNGTHS